MRGRAIQNLPASFLSFKGHGNVNNCNLKRLESGLRSFPEKIANLSALHIDRLSSVRKFSKIAKQYTHGRTLLVSFTRARSFLWLHKDLSNLLLATYLVNNESLAGVF